MKKYFYFIVIILALLASIRVNRYVTIDFDIENPHKIHTGYFYYDSDDHGYIHKSFSYKSNHVHVMIAQRKIESLRFDPMDGNNSIVIKNIKINGQSIQKSDKLVLKPLHAIASIRELGRNRYLITASGDDPYLVLAKNLSAIYDWKSLHIHYQFFIFLCILIALVYFDIFTIKKVKRNMIENLKAYVLVYLITFFIFLIMLFANKFDFSNADISFFSKMAFFDRFVDEFVITYLLIFILFKRYKFFIFLVFFILFLYIVINISQLIVLAISGEFLTKLALDNIEFIGLMVNWENLRIVISLIFVLFVLPAFIAWVVVRFTPFYKVFLNYYFLAILLLVGAGTHFSNKLFNDKTIEERDRLYKQNRIEHTAPIQSLVKVLKKKKNHNIHFTNKEIQELTKLGFHLSPISNYPFEKSIIYKEHKFKIHKKPNIIILFTEGYSARTCNVYNKNFKDLTPNLLNFSKDKNSMVVRNYFNHTAATYRGLHGQLCSFYPTYGGVGGWADNIKNLPQVTYLSLADVLEHNGYETVWLNMHYQNASSNDEMMQKLDFNTVLSAEDLLKNYLGGIQGKRGDFLTDQKAYEILVDYLKEKKNSKKPFMIGMYTVQTHAWIDTASDGLKYKHGKFNGLNTIHNMDNAFGTFWNYFKDSKYAKNTIVIFTADHAHYYEKSFVKAMNEYAQNDYKKVFVDKIPLIIYNPITNLPAVLNGYNATSVDLAPTIAQMLDLKNEKNFFMGTSLFEQDKNHIGLTAIGTDIYLIKNNTIEDDYTVSNADKHTLDLLKKLVSYLHQVENKNHLISTKKQQKK